MSGHAVAPLRSAPRISIVLVVAVADNGVIGQDGGLPWRLKSDLAHFRSVTINKPVVMGRKTCLSIGKALKNRTNIVVTRDRLFAMPGVVVARSGGRWAVTKAAKRSSITQWTSCTDIFR